MIAQLASSSNLETSIAPVRPGDLSLVARPADGPRQLRALRMRQSGGRRDPQAGCIRDPRRPLWPGTRDALNG
jgi:hypothetical protein